MKIIGIQNYANITHPHLENKKAESNVQRQDYNCQYNPIYYMPSFKSQTTDKFTELFEQGLEEDLPQDKLDKLSSYIFKIEEEVTNDENCFLGSGCSFNVYKINDDYALRVPKRRIRRDNPFRYRKNSDFNDLPCYYGGILASCDYLSILKNADPKGNAIVAGEPKWLKGDEASDYMFNTSLPAFANLPQSAYDNYAYTLKLLNDKSGESDGLPERCLPDFFNSNNFLAVDNEIRIVDGIMVSCDKNEWNNLATMCLPIYSDIDSCSLEKKAETTRNEKEIFKKCVLGSEEAELALPCSRADFNCLGRIMKICNYNTDKNDFVDFLKSTREQEPDKEKRKQTIAEYLDNME